MQAIYHSRDLDGFCSAAVVKTKYPNAKLIGYDYGQPMPKIEPGEPVIMIDISMPMEKMNEIGKQRGGNLTWIDHHISQIKEYEEFKKNNKVNFDAVLQDGIAACEVGWKHLFPDEEMPETVRLLGEYDTWRVKDKKEYWEGRVLPFQFGMKLICNGPENFPMFMIDPKKHKSSGVASNIDEIIEKGKIAMRYQKQMDDKTAESNAFEIEFEGLRAICLNTGGMGSATFESVYDDKKHDIMIRFHYNGNKWIISLYSDNGKTDCSKIAKKYGGGGHFGASGMELSHKQLFDIILF